ncbi:division/cell wall cluster transcriptional repressor MraZ [Oceanicola sp. 22II-s10i]|uniref:division/cell wall cluster transcriptional repressor MraZ n=1 Tax=Oceanicola sp. 22II-s10i TaxID=1317116 RepID=UPI000B5278F2|nr:cell division/cell wall cluster transcriptional repressor MraZ [Oceanicola sp. 22II-s10i]
MDLGRFRGEHHLKMDSKGRVSIPAEFRRVLEAGDPTWSEGAAPTMFINYGDHLLPGCLEVYSVAALREIEDLIDDMDMGSEEQEEMITLYTSQSEMVRLDDTGRAVMPQKLRDKMGAADGMQMFVRGRGKTFELWNPEAYREAFPEQDDTARRERLRGLNPKQRLNDIRQRRDARE